MLRHFCISEFQLNETRGAMVGVHLGTARAKGKEKTGSVKRCNIRQGTTEGAWHRECGNGRCKVQHNGHRPNHLVSGSVKGEAKRGGGSHKLGPEALSPKLWYAPRIRNFLCLLSH